MGSFGKSRGLLLASRGFGIQYSDVLGLAGLRSRFSGSFGLFVGCCRVLGDSWAGCWRPRGADTADPGIISSMKSY